jgi:hypothetical protein
MENEKVNQGNNMKIGSYRQRRRKDKQKQHKGRR